MERYPRVNHKMYKRMFDAKRKSKGLFQNLNFGVAISIVSRKTDDRD